MCRSMSCRGCEALLKKNIGGLICKYEQADPDEEEGQNPFPDLFDQGSRCRMTGELIGEQTHQNSRRYAAAPQIRTNIGFKSAKSGVMMLTLSLLLAKRIKAKPQ